MTSILRLSASAYLRAEDVRGVLAHLAELRCVSVTGFSNVGKSEFLRLLADPQVWTAELGERGAGFLPVYIDCNRMLEMTDQGFYELILRCLQETDPDLARNQELTDAYETLIAPRSEFQVPLSFNRGLDAVLHATDRRLVLILDEFDEPFQQIDSRVFLNLRAKKDRNWARLAYVTATVHALTGLRNEEHTGEFCELFVHHTWPLRPMGQEDVRRWVALTGEEECPRLDEEDVAWMMLWAGGHPGMLTRLRSLLLPALEGAASSAARWSARRGLEATLVQDPVLQQECAKIWQQCGEEERRALTALLTGGDPAAAESRVLRGLRRRGLLQEENGSVRVFARLFAEFIQTQAGAQPSPQPRPPGPRVYVDEESGQVYLDGAPIPPLTRLEHRLMTLLATHAGAIVDKYRIVEEVWGDAYIDNVDDARIEKLVSRLRQKVEPDPSDPQFIKTVRGRGYQLDVN